MDDVLGVEVPVDIDRELGPGLLAQLGRHLGDLGSEVADMTDRGQDGVVRPEVLGDLLRLGRRLHDHQGLVGHVFPSAVNPDREACPDGSVRWGDRSVTLAPVLLSTW